MLAQGVADILSRHVTLSVEAIDRMYLNVFVPGLQWLENGCPLPPQVVSPIDWIMSDMIGACRAIRPNFFFCTQSTPAGV